MAGLYDELLVLLHGIWNRRWVALAVAWGVAMLGWLGVALIPNSYQSKARVYVNTQSLLEDRMGITQVQSQQDLDRLRSTLASAENLEKVVRGTDLSQSVSGPRDIAAKITIWGSTWRLLGRFRPHFGATWANKLNTGKPLKA